MPLAEAVALKTTPPLLTISALRPSLFPTIKFRLRQSEPLPLIRAKSLLLPVPPPINASSLNTVPPSSTRRRLLTLPTPLTPMFKLAKLLHTEPEPVTRARLLLRLLPIVAEPLTLSIRPPSRTIN